MDGNFIARVRPSTTMALVLIYTDCPCVSERVMMTSVVAAQVSLSVIFAAVYDERLLGGRTVVYSGATYFSMKNTV